MGDIVKGVISNAWALVVGWALPSALVLSGFSVLILPSFAPPSSSLGWLVTASLGGQALAVLVASVILGWTLSALQTPLYRILEGYLLWPGWLREAGVKHHRKRRRSLLHKRWYAIKEGDPIAIALATDRLRRYPDGDDQDIDKAILPTRLGNAIRRFEIYGHDRYRLDSQSLWYHLRAVVPDLLVRDVESSRVGVDFFVCLVYTLGALTASATLAVALHPSDWLRLAPTAAIAALLAVVCYLGAVSATDEWSSAVQAMVDLGRAPLARSLGLSLPEDLEGERNMWEALDWSLCNFYTPKRAARVDYFRTKLTGDGSVVSSAKREAYS